MHSRDLGTLGNVVAAVVCNLRVAMSARLRVAMSVRSACLFSSKVIEDTFQSVQCFARFLLGTD